MRRARLPLTALRAFEAAGRHQSFRKAADELSVSEAAISRQVRDLERLLGVPLFTREHRAVHLNQRGDRLLVQLTQGLDVIDAALTTAMAVPERLSVAVSVEPTFASLLLIPRLADFSKAHPDIAVHIEVSAELADLHAEGPRLAIRHGRAQASWPRVQARHLFDVDLTPMLVPGLVPASPAGLAAVKLLLDEDDDGWTRWLALAGISAPMLWGPVFSNSAIAIQGAELGQGAALGNRRLASRQLASGALLAPFATDLPRGAYWLLARDFNALTKAETCFCDWLAAEAIG